MIFFCMLIPLSAFEVVTWDFCHRISFNINLLCISSGMPFSGDFFIFHYSLPYCFVFREDCISIPVYSYSEVSVVSMSFCEILSSLGCVSLQMLLFFKTANTVWKYMLFV